MCGISGPELIVIVVVAIIVMGPERLPELMKNAGRFMREVRRMTGDLGQVTREIQSTLSVDELRNQIRQELATEREKIRRITQEAEIDLIRDRRKKPADAIVDMATGGATGAVALAKAEPAAAAAEAAASSPASAESDAAVMKPRVALSKPVSAGVDDDADEALPPLPTVRPARGSVAQAPPPRAAAAAAPASVAAAAPGESPGASDGETP